MRMLAFCLTIFVILAWDAFSYAGELGNTDEIDNAYSDESHCLSAPEIRGEKDNSISCFCRDAIIEPRYVYQNYLLTGKDRNLNGVYLTLVDHARQMCGEEYDVYNATQAEAWQWEGPQVAREYPPESDLLKIKPDSKGFRTIEYKVHLIYLDKGGRVTKVKDFNASEKLPANLIKK
jgi:hypothetical protein